MCSVVVNFSSALYLFDFSNVFLCFVQSLGDSFLNRKRAYAKEREREKDEVEKERKTKPNNIRETYLLLL